MDDLERAFHRAMVSIYETAKVDLGYNATRFMQMIADVGGVAAARQLVRATQPSDGFTTLWEHHRLDLSVEAHVIKPQFSCLFNEDEIETARERLAAYGYAF